MRLRKMNLIVYYSYLPPYLSLIASLIPKNQTPIDLQIFLLSLSSPLIIPLTIIPSPLVHFNFLPTPQHGAQ